MKVVNRRITLFIALSLALGVFLGGSMTGNKIISILIPLIVIIGGIVLLFITKKPLILIVFLALAVGMAAFSIDHAISHGEEFSGECTVTCRVKSVKGKVTEVSDVVINGDKVNGYGVVYLNDEYETGEILTFSGKVRTREVNFLDQKSASNYAGRTYYVFDDIKGLEVSNGELTLIEKLKKRAEKSMKKFLSAENAGVMKSLLFGDKTELNEYDEDMINGVGLAHVFAVSGLHVGFIAAVLSFLFRKAKLRPYVSIPIILFFFIVYGMVTGFPSGLKRAAVMYVISALSVPLGRKNDPLSSLSLAASVILLTNPRELYDIGFIMSISAVLGIICFYKPIAKAIDGKIKNKPLNYLLKTGAVTITANIFILPTMFNVFGAVSVYSVVSNVLVLPIVSITFPVAAVSAILGAINVYAGAPFFLTGYALDALRAISKFVYSLPYSAVRVSEMGIMTIFYVIGFIALSDKVILKKQLKFAISGSCFVTMFILTFI